mmetsp:Transcript_24846/g.54100  ORF Transcript_24846/g.54100 Transcript_24846/m.54100 type:complete len:111 (+) Transcript_24846:33-365(+)
MSARSTLRGLLRAIDQHVTSISGNRQWREFVLAEFRAGASLEDQKAIESRLNLARDYTLLVSNVAHHKNLLITYNIGVDPDERNKKMVEAVAKRVGFALPKASGNEQQSI